MAGTGVQKPPEQFLEEANTRFNNKFTYDLTNYKNNRTKIIVICPEHGPENMTPKAHFRSPYGCTKCGISGKSKKAADTKREPSKNKFLEAALRRHRMKYDYSKMVYVTLRDEIIIICPVHGEFNQTPLDHIRSSGCEICDPPKMSQGEAIIANWLNDRKIEFIFQFRIDKSIDDPTNNTGHGYDGMLEIRKLRFDFYLSYYDLFIEFDGRQHEEIVEKFGGVEGLLATQANDAIKNEFCERCHLDLLRINHREFDDIEQILDAKIKKKKEQGY